jgi:hypothetical protein
MRRRSRWVLLAVGCMWWIAGGCNSTGGIGCANEPASTAQRPRQPATSPSRAQVFVGGTPTRTQQRGIPEPEYDYEPEPKATPRQRARQAPRKKADPPPRQVNGVWRFSSAPQFLDGYLGRNHRSRYRGRVQVTGKVLQVIDMGPAGGRRLWLEGGRRQFVEARFRDNGRAAAGVRKGRTVSVECTPTAKIGKNAQLGDCVLR